jgi:hypothetical protein
MQSDNGRARRLVERLGSVRVIGNRGGTVVIVVELGGRRSRPSLVRAPPLPAGEREAQDPDGKHLTSCQDR